MVEATTEPTVEPTDQPPRLTAEDLLALPDDGLRRELIEGEVVTMAPAGEEHGAVGSALTSYLYHHILTHRLGRTYMAETGFVLSRDPDTVLAPDGAFTRAERMAQLRQGFADVMPDLVVEIASPSNTQRELWDKAMRWLEAGVQVVLLLYPSSRRLLLIRGGDDIVTLTAADTLVLDDLLPGFALPLGQVFSPPPSHEN